MTREHPTAADQYDFTDVAPFAALPDAPQPVHEQPRQVAQAAQQVQPAQPVQPTQAEPQTEVIKAQSPGPSTPGFALGAAPAVGASAAGSTAADVGGATAQARSQTPQQQEHYESTPYGTQLGGAARNEEQRYESNPYGGGSYEQRAEQRPALSGAEGERGSRVQDTPEPRRIPQTTARDSEAYGETYGEPYGDAQQRPRSEARTSADGKQGGSKSGLVILAAICVVLLMIFVLGLLILLNVVPFPGL